MASISATPWILKAPSARPPPSPPPLLSLLCFAPAGASAASAFYGWERELPADVMMMPVELPGRAGRIKEPAVYDMQQLLEEMLAPGSGILPALHARPFVLFGHSMGAWVAFALARELERRGGPLPFKLYVSANRSPLLAGVAHDVDPTTMHQLAEGSPGPFWAAMERRYGPNKNLEHPAIRKLLLPTLLADFRLIETWRPLGGPPAITSRAAGTSSPDAADGSTAASVDEVPDSGAALALPCPLAALGATQDPRYRPGQLAAWHACAPAGGYEERWFEGGHSYITADGPGRQALLDWLGGDLHQLAAALAVVDGLDGSSAAEEPAAAATGAVDGAPATAEPAAVATAEQAAAAIAAGHAAAQQVTAGDVRSLQQQQQQQQAEAPAPQSEPAAVPPQEEQAMAPQQQELASRLPTPPQQQQPVALSAPRPAISFCLSCWR